MRGKTVGREIERHRQLADEGVDLVQGNRHRILTRLPGEEQSICLIDFKVSIKPYCCDNAALYRSQCTPGLQNLLSLGPTKSSENWSGSVRLGLSTSSGFAARSKCFEQRFVHCQHLGVLLDNTNVGQFYPAIKSAENSPGIAHLLDCSVFMFFSPTSDELASKSEAEQAKDIEEIFARTSLKWLLDAPPKRKTLALIHGRDNIHHFYLIQEAASRLNISLVILDTDGHWLQDQKYRHMYDHFVPIDMTVDDEFHLRIVRTVSEFGSVDAICTVSDRCLYPVARAAEMLGLPTELPNAVRKSISKFETRLLDDTSASSTALVGNFKELDSLLQSGRFQPQYPLIVKPSQGWGSELVFKVNDGEQLQEAVCKTQNGFSKQVLVEAYLDGPELDVNFILHDGRIVFFEIADDFPSSADQGEGSNVNFWENSNILPSALPVQEYACVKNSMYGLLTRLGFQNGVFHIEAKVPNSSMEFTKEHGVMDLRRSSYPLPAGQPRCCVIEVNPRPPGFPCIYATRASYGVNLFDAHLLASLRDERLEMMSQPFEAHEQIGGQARMWSQIVFFQADRTGVCTSDNSCGDFIRETPELNGHVVESYCFFKERDVIPAAPPGVVLFGAFFIVASFTSREEVSRLGQMLRDGFCIPIETT